MFRPTTAIALKIVAIALIFRLISLIPTIVYMSWTAAEEGREGWLVDFSLPIIILISFVLAGLAIHGLLKTCLLYTSDAADE